MYTLTTSHDLSLPFCDQRTLGEVTVHSARLGTDITFILDFPIITVASPELIPPNARCVSDPDPSVLVDSETGTVIYSIKALSTTIPLCDVLECIVDKLDHIQEYV